MSNQLDLLTQGSFFAQSNREVEEIVLGTFINYSDTYYFYSNQLTVDSFESKEHKEIFNAITELGKDSKIDLITVRDKLIQKGIVQYYLSKQTSFDILEYVDELCDRVQTDENIEAHVNLLITYSSRRSLLNLFGEGTKMINSMELPMDIINFTTSGIVKIQQQQDASTYNLHALLSEATKNAETGSVTRGEKTYFVEVDDFIYQFDPGNLVIGAGPPGMGKTSFFLDVVRKRVLNDQPTALFSLEMKQIELINKLMSAQAEIPLNRIRRKQMTPDDWDRWHDAISLIENKPLYIDDKARNIYHIGNKIKQYYLRYGVKLFVIDYLQLISITLGNKSNREQEVATISRYLKELAQELGVVIIALSQLSREHNKRTNKRPVLSDLRESGAIEQDADCVIFVYREAYYDIERIAPPIHDAEIIFAKMRNGETGTVMVQFKGECAKFLSKSDLYGYTKTTNFQPNTQFDNEAGF
jgi:replicative DNA helicase